MMKKKRFFGGGCLALACILLAGILSAAWAADTGWDSAGVRAGIDDGNNDEDFVQVEAFGRFGTPWFWGSASHWRLGMYLEGNAGVLNGAGDNALVVSAGPGIYLKTPGDRIAVWLGINPTVISSASFGDENLGGPFQFTSHAGIEFNFARHFSIGYRIQHMSNAGFYDHNPGLNLHMLQLGYRF